MLYQYNVQTNSLVRAIGKADAGGVGTRISNVPEITFSTVSEWTVQFCSVENGRIEAVDVSRALTWRAAVDHDYDPETEPMCRTLNDHIDRSNAADGKIKVRLNANTIGFREAMNSVQSRDAWFELWGLDSQEDAIYYCKFKIKARMPLDPVSGEEPEELESLWADRAWVTTQLQNLETPVLELAGLSDVSGTETAANGQALLFDSASALWKPGTVAVETGPSALAGLSDVSGTETAANGQALLFDSASASWKPGTVAIEQEPYTAGDGIAIVEHEISADSTLARQSAVTAALANKVDKVTGKGLSANDYDDTAKSKVDNLAAVASSGSYSDLGDKPSIPAVLTDLADVGDLTGAENAQALLYDAAAGLWKPGSVSSSGGVSLIPAIAVGEPDAGTIQVRPVNIDAAGVASWASAAVTAFYTWGVQDE